MEELYFAGGLLCEGNFIPKNKVEAVSPPDSGFVGYVKSCIARLFV